MRAVVQRVQKASVSIENTVKSRINQGILVLLGIEEEDSEADIDWLVSKIIQMRIFSDGEGKMNLSLKEVDGEMLVVSQFTLHASIKKGNRPSFMRAAKPETARPLYELFVHQSRVELNKDVQTGEFGAMMDIESINSGPVTILMDSKNKE